MNCATLTVSKSFGLDVQCEFLKRPLIIGWIIMRKMEVKV